jgi:sugar phosphate isomerase/epimerase
MKLSFSTLGCPDYTIDEIIAAAKKYSYHGVELRTVESTVNLWEVGDLNSRSLERTRKKFEAAGLEVVVVGTGGSFAAASEEKRREQTDQLKRWAEIARGLDCPYLRVFGGPVPGGQTMEETLKWDIEGYNQVLPLMKSYGITLLFETHDSFSRSPALLPLLKGLTGEAGVIWDILHPYRFGEALETTWKGLGPYVRHVHLKDSRVFSEKGFDFSLPGEGLVPIPELLGILKANAYGGYLSFEWEKGWHPEIPSCQIAFPRFIEYITPYL